MVACGPDWFAFDQRIDAGVCKHRKLLFFTSLYKRLECLVCE